MRKVLYVTGTRADYGLMASTLARIAAHPALSLQVAVQTLCQSFAMVQIGVSGNKIGG